MMVAAEETRQDSVDIDPDWYAGQPETSEDAANGESGAAPPSCVPTVLTKLQKWGDYDSWGDPVWPSRFIPMKTPLSQDILDNWQLSNPPKHRLTVADFLTAQAAAGRHIGLILDLSNHDCLYESDVPPTVDYLHVQLVAKELPPLEFVQDVGAAANRHWGQHSDSYIAIHCAYGFNRTGFVVCSYLVENCSLSVEQALQSFARSRPPGVKHEKFKNELHARYGVCNMHISRPITSCSPVCSACGQVSNSNSINGSNNSSNCSSSRTAAGISVVWQAAKPQEDSAVEAAAAGESSHCSSSTAAVEASRSAASSNTSPCSSLPQRQPPAAAAAAATTTAFGRGSEQPLIFAGPARSCSSGSGTSCAKPPPAPQLAQLVSSSSGVDTYNSSLRLGSGLVPDCITSPLPVISNRSYSCGSMGDNSSIGCSPDTAADILIIGSSTHGSSDQGALRSPLGAGQQQQQQLGPGVRWLGRRGSGSSGISRSNSQIDRSDSTAAAADASSPRGQPGVISDSANSCVSAAAAAAAAGEAAGADGDIFEMDPCIDSEQQQQHQQQDLQRNCADGVCCFEQQQQLRQQDLPTAQQLSQLMDAVRVTNNRQQQQQEQGRVSVTSHGQLKQQQQSPDYSSKQQAVKESTPLQCGCSCHLEAAVAVAAVAASGGEYAVNGGVWQTQRQHQSLPGGDDDPMLLAGTAVGALHALRENESFGRVTSADLMQQLRSLQQQQQQQQLPN